MKTMITVIISQIFISLVKTGVVKYPPDTEEAIVF